MGFTCATCDGDSYYEQDGLYFCNECNAQSQVSASIEIILEIF